MAFSQQSYTGQGIVQPTERSRVGELFGAGLAGLGAGVGEGIKKFQQNKEEAKELRSNLKRLRSFIPKEQQDEFDSQVEAGSLSDLRGLKRGILERGAMELQQIQLQEAKDKVEAKRQEGKFYSELTEARQPQDVPVDFAPQIDAAEARLQRAQESAGFRPEFKFTADQFTDSVSDSEAGRSLAESEARALERFSLPSSAVNAFAPYGAGAMPRQTQAPLPGTARSPEIIAREEMQAMRRYAAPVQTYQPAPSRAQGPLGPEAMPGPSEAVVKAAKDLELLKVAEQKGETRSETATEVRDRLIKDIPNLVKENPLMAKQAYELLYDQDNKLTFENKLSLLKYQDSVKSRFIPGLGTAPSVETAKEMRTLQLADDQIQSGIGRLLEILDTPGKRFDLDLKKESNTIVGLLTGALRVPIVGPGAFSEPERQLIEGIIANPTKLFSIDSNTRTSLDTLAKRMRDNRDSYAKLIGLDPYQEGAVAGQKASDVSRMSFNPSTGLIE